MEVSGVGFSWTVGTPILTPGAGSYTAQQSVVVTCATSGATIHYTTNGADPTEADPTVASGGTVVVSQGLTLKAKAWKVLAPAPSAVVAASYSFTVPVPTPSVGAGTYSLPQSLALSSSVGATIYYTTDGTTPTTASPVYTTAIAVNATTTLKALGVRSGWTSSAVGSWTYTLVAASPSLSPPGGAFGAAQSVTLTDATPGADIHYNGGACSLPGPSTRS